MRRLSLFALLGLCLLLITGFLIFCTPTINQPLLAEVTENIQTIDQVKYYNVAFMKDVDSEKLAGIWVLVEDTGNDLYRFSFQTPSG